ncbi:hypothetical protein CBR_g19320 [Chara braunii]|uniref:Sister chromatid cohesion protein n=1 Tax=Chara braunii TaxID=69332 RepID=A0A388KXM2_CHABU|nr:hypothetical protein CBR_g19320 [Chara braunii]|eukprot:GBG74809.1 hypothetical protein CBR_g19320 [Chara braunii]
MEEGVRGIRMNGVGGGKMGGREGVVLDKERMVVHHKNRHIPVMWKKKKKTMKMKMMKKKKTKTATKKKTWKKEEGGGGGGGGEEEEAAAEEEEEEDAAPNNNGLSSAPLLFNAVQQGNSDLTSWNWTPVVDGEEYAAALLGLEASHVSLTIMTAPKMPKQAYEEEIIDNIIGTMRTRTLSMFCSSDAADGGDDDGDGSDGMNGGDTGGARKRGRKAPMKTRKVQNNKLTKTSQVLFDKLCGITHLLGDLLGVTRIQDGTVLQLSNTALAIFNAGNVQLLQLKALGVVCTVFDNYPQHRNLILDEVISLLWKQPVSKRNLRTYHLLDEDTRQIQMSSALLLQLIQCCVSLPNPGAEQVPKTEDKSDPKQKQQQGEADTSNSAKGYEVASEAATYFWIHFLQRWGNNRGQDTTVYKVLLDNLVADLLLALNTPEFPGASLLLQVLCIMLCGQLGLQSKDGAIRCMAIDHLGSVAARLKADAAVSSNDTLWVLRDLCEEEDRNAECGEKERPLKQRQSRSLCAVCSKPFGGKFSIECRGCRTIFHGNCVGIGEHDHVGKEWSCYPCLCEKQLASLEAELGIQRQQTNGYEGNGEVKDKHKDKEKEKGCGGSFPEPGKLKAENRSGCLVLQQLLLEYLMEAGKSDPVIMYARRFYICQWYRDEGCPEHELGFYKRRLQLRGPGSDVGAGNLLTREMVVCVSRALGQQRPLARGFERIFRELLACLWENSPTPRAKSLRAVGAVIEADPSVLGDVQVQKAVEGRFLDSAISVREAALELVGKHITNHPEYLLQYYDKIAERIMDTGVSVRKRVIKIIRDVCVQPKFPKTTDACTRLISRINDDEQTIQDLVTRTLYELWFDPESGGAPCGKTGEVSKAIVEKAQQLVDVLSAQPSHTTMVTVIKRSLMHGSAGNAVELDNGFVPITGAVRQRCELLCRCLLESVLKQAEEAQTEQSEAEALPYVLALHAFASVDPYVCAQPDPARFAVTLLPYLKTQQGTKEVAQLLHSLVSLIDGVLPLLQRPPTSFVEELDVDLRQLILRHSHLTVVQACVKCLSSLGKVASKGVQSFESLTKLCYTRLRNLRSTSPDPKEKMIILRSLFVLSQLCRYGAENVDKMAEYSISMNGALNLFLELFQSNDAVVRMRTLQGLGYLFVARPDYMMAKNVDAVLRSTLAPGQDSHIKVQTLKNFLEYLLDVEASMEALARDSFANGVVQQQDGYVPDAAGAGDNNICGGIIQLYWEEILDACINMNDDVRHSSLKIVEVVLRQGLVHPMTCVPHLVALEVDSKESIWQLAHHLLMQLNEKYPAIFESRLGDGLQLSYTFQQSLAGSQREAKGGESGSATSRSNRFLGHAAVDGTADCVKQGMARVYKLVRGNRASRNKFLSSIIRKYDSSGTGDLKADLLFLSYCSHVVAALPFVSVDELLYLVHTINQTVQLRGGTLQSSMKAILTGEGPLARFVDQTLRHSKRNRTEDGTDACPPANTGDAKRQCDVRIDNIPGIHTDVVKQIKVDCRNAVAVSLLLLLKCYLKSAYSITDAKCQAYSPADAVKNAEAATRKDSAGKFDCGELSLGRHVTARQMWENYQVLKRLLNEDSSDFVTFVSPLKRKGGQSNAATTLQESGGAVATSSIPNGQEAGNGRHPETGPGKSGPRMTKRKSARLSEG